MDLTVKTPATVTSIDVGLVKAGKRIRHANEDDLIRFWIKAADGYVEKRTNTALMAQTFVLRLSRILPVVQLPRPPLKTIVAASYTPEGGAKIDFPDLNAAVRIDRMLATVDTGLQEQPGTMIFEYQAGSDQPDNVEASLRQAVFLLAGHYVTAREASYLDPRIMNVDKKIVFGVDELIKDLRVPNAHELNGGY